jgi:outer membrane receptor protein involved in Fe transport
LSLRDPNNHQAYNGNGGRAKSQGVELSVRATPVTGLTASAWVAWNDAKLSEALPAASPAVGADGDRLPDSSRFSGNVSIEDSFPLIGKLSGFVAATVSYVGDRAGVFVTPGATRESFPGYAKTDLRGGVLYDTWTFNVYVNNATDKRGLLEGGAEYNPPYGYVYIQPRSIGLTAVKEF